MSKNWYEIRNAGDGIVEVLLYDEIGGWGISAKDFARDLRAIKANTINVRIDSPGGAASEGITIYNVLRNHKATVHTIVDGAAYSIASVVAQAGETRVMNRGSTMMIHEPYGLVVGNEADMLKEAEVLNLMAGNIAGLFADRAGGTEADWRDRMKAESWYRAEQAVDIGLADGIVQGQPQNRAVVFNLSRFKNVPEWIQDKAIGSHSTATSEGAWDGPGNKARLSNDETGPYYRKAFAWEDPDADPDTKAAYKFIHHEVGGDGAIGAANMTGCSAGIAVLNGGRGGTTIPTEDKQGVWNHLAGHLRDGDREPPPLDELASPVKDGDDLFTGIDWAGVLGEYARYVAPEPNLEKLLAEHPVEEAFSRKDN